MRWQVFKREEEKRFRNLKILITEVKFKIKKINLLKGMKKEWLTNDIEWNRKIKSNFFPSVVQSKLNINSAIHWREGLINKRI